MFFFFVANLREFNEKLPYQSVQCSVPTYFDEQATFFLLSLVPNMWYTWYNILKDKSLCKISEIQVIG